MDNQLLLLEINVVCDSPLTVSGKAGEVVMIPFSGDASGPFFTGKIIGPAVDTQKIGKDGSFRLSARYMLEGVDSAGNACRVFIENQGNEAEGFCPWLVTDSPVLQQWEGKKLTATIGGTPQGVLVRIREAGEP